MEKINLGTLAVIFFVLAFQTNDVDLARKCRFNMCEDVSNYPLDKIRRLTSSQANRDFLSFFGNIIEPHGSLELGPRNGYEELGIGNRLCQSQRYTMMPRLALSVNNENSTIINIEDFEQTVIFEICSLPESKCRHHALLTAYDTGCVQKYNIIKLLIMSKNGTDIEYGRFRVPSTCVCTYRVDNQKN